MIAYKKILGRGALFKSRYPDVLGNIRWVLKGNGAEVVTYPFM